MHTMSTPLISGIIFILLYCANGGVNNGVQEYFGVQVVTSPKISQTSSPKVIHVERALFDNGNVKKNNTMTDVMNNIASAANQTNKTENDLAITSKPGQVDIETMTIIPKKIRDDIVQSGALLRGFYVFLGLSLLIIMYLFFRSNRLNKGNTSPALVQKYGIRAHRSDLEMQPLPLAEEEEEDTVFEIGNGSSLNR